MTSPTVPEVLRVIAGCWEEYMKPRPVSESCPAFSELLRTRASEYSASPPRGGDGAGLDEALARVGLACVHGRDSTLCEICRSPLPPAAEAGEPVIGDPLPVTSVLASVSGHAITRCPHGWPIAMSCSECEKANRRAQPIPGAGEGRDFQARVAPWMQACFGPEISADKIERNHRFYEEAGELVQANGMTREEAHQLVDYTWDRPAGNPHQEVGGVMVTLAALCLASGLDMEKAAEDELARIWTKVDAIRAKQAAKPKYSPLPEAPPAPAPVEPLVGEITLRIADPGAFVGMKREDETVSRWSARAVLAYMEPFVPPPATGEVGREWGMFRSQSVQEFDDAARIGDKMAAALAEQQRENERLRELEAIVKAGIVAGERLCNLRKDGKTILDFMTLWIQQANTRADEALAQVATLTTSLDQARAVVEKYAVEIGKLRPLFNQNHTPDDTYIRASVPIVLNMMAIEVAARTSRESEHG